MAWPKGSNCPAVLAHWGAEEVGQSFGVFVLSSGALLGRSYWGNFVPEVPNKDVISKHLRRDSHCRGNIL